jgi:hypothetical protein
MTTKVQFLTSLGTTERVFSAKEVADLPSDLATAWVRAGFCVPLEVANQTIEPSIVETTSAPVVEDATAPSVDTISAKPRRKRSGSSLL